MNHKELIDAVNSKYGIEINQAIIEGAELKARNRLYMEYSIPSEKQFSYFEEEYNKIAEEGLNFEPALNFYFIKAGKKK